MTTKTEISRIEAVEAYPSYETHCVVCSKPITLFFNGGELDMQQCCGRDYWLESPQTDFVIYERKEGQ